MYKERGKSRLLTKDGHVLEGKGFEDRSWIFFRSRVLPSHSSNDAIVCWFVSTAALVPLH
jgi:hypothetical protein